MRPAPRENGQPSSSVFPRKCAAGRLSVITTRPVPGIVLRREPRPGDENAVLRLVAETDFFSREEAEMAGELVRERLERGAASGYHFLFADAVSSDHLLGYACFGPISCTLGSFDLYWIAAASSLRGQGLGSHLLKEVEIRAAAMDCRRLYAETSSRPLYAPTRAFYERRGFAPEARLADFYAPGDDKIIYAKRLG